MSKKSFFAMVGALFCICSLFLSVKFMGTPIYGYQILLISLFSFDNLSDLPFFFAAVATLVSIFCISVFIKTRYYIYAFTVAIVGSVCGFSIAFKGGYPQYLGEWLWLCGLFFSLVSCAFKPMPSFKQDWLKPAP
jgi:hypothetical protein